MNLNIKRGDVYYAELPNSQSSAQSGCRPVLVIQNNIGNRFAPTVIIAPLTTRKKRHMPTHVDVMLDCGLNNESTVLVEQIMTIGKEQLSGVCLTRLPESVMDAVNQAIAVSVGLSPAAKFVGAF